MSYSTYLLQGRVYGEGTEDWFLLRTPNRSIAGVEVKARSIKEALSRLHRGTKYALCFQPGIELRLLDDEGKVVATQSKRDDESATLNMTLVATND